MSCSRIWVTAAAVVAAISTLALMTLSNAQGFGMLVGLVAIVSVAFIYWQTRGVQPQCSAGEEHAPPTASAIASAIDKTLEGGDPDLSSFDPAVADAVERVADKLDWLAREIVDLSPSDEATSLVKEEVFNNVLWREFNRAQRYKASMSVVLVEINDYEKYSSGHGPDAAGRLVRHVASTILQMVRESDLAARYGEDRLAIIMPETGHDGADEFSQRLSRAIEETAVDGDGGAVKVSVTIGLASVPADDVATAPDLVEKAARALEQAKEPRSGGVTG